MLVVPFVPRYNDLERDTCDAINLPLGEQSCNHSGMIMRDTVILWGVSGVIGLTEGKSAVLVAMVLHAEYHILVHGSRPAKVNCASPTFPVLTFMPTEPSIECLIVSYGPSRRSYLRGSFFLVCREQEHVVKIFP